MTSASELFYKRRCSSSRFGGGGESAAAVFDSSSPLYHHHRTTTSSLHHHRHHRHSTNSTTVTSRRRSDLQGCDPLRPHHHHHLPHRPPPPNPNPSERDSSRGDEASGQASSDGSVYPHDLGGGIGNGGRRYSRNDRLPGPVVLARERLLERLRGVSTSANRRSNRASAYLNRNDLIAGDDSGLVDAWEYLNTEILGESSARDDDLLTSILQTDQQLSVTRARSKSKPPGLTEEQLHRLQVETFTKSNSYCDGEKIMTASQECSICLESFANGDELICLPCAHRFHFGCLDPWVRTCGDCPYCRKGIV